MSSNVTATPLTFVWVAQEAAKFPRVASPANHPVEPLDGTADGMDRDDHLLSVLQGEFTRQFQGTAFVNRLEFHSHVTTSEFDVDNEHCTASTRKKELKGLLRLPLSLPEARPSMKSILPHDYLAGLGCLAVFGGLLLPLNLTASVIVLVLWAVATIVCMLKHR